MMTHSESELTGRCLVKLGLSVKHWKSNVRSAEVHADIDQCSDIDA